MNKEQMNQLIKEVGEWSKDNFGEQETLVLQVVPLKEVKKFSDWQDLHPRTVESPVACLGSLAPLLGIVEEYGEFVDAVSEEDRQDAIGDIIICLCDYCSREGIGFPEYEPSRDTTLGVEVGRLVHATLKRMQGIRGYDNREKYEESRNFALRGIVSCLIQIDHQALQYGIDTWNKIVKKRNWKKQGIEAANKKDVCPNCHSSNLYRSSMNPNNLICRECGQTMTKEN